MSDDVSQIPISGCSVLSSSDTLSNYNNYTRKDFVFNGGKWYLQRTVTSSYSPYDTSSYNCIDVTSLNSYALYQPFLYGLAFCLFLVTVVVFFKTIKGLLHVI